MSHPSRERPGAAAIVNTVPVRRIAALFLALAVAAAGCGGDSDESAERPRTTATTPTDKSAAARDTRTAPAAPRRAESLTATQYRSTVNRLCREDAEAAERLGDVDTPESIEPFLRRLLKYSRKREPLYERLRPPSSLRASHRDFIRLNDEGDSWATRLIARIERGGDPVEEFTSAAPALGRLINKGNRLARRMGTRDCMVDVPSRGAQSPQNFS